MKLVSALVISTLLLSALPTQAAVQKANPVEKVLSMIADLQAKIVKEGEAAQKTYDEFAEWCEDRSRSVGFEIQDGKKDVASETANIESATAKIASFKTKVEELADAISVNEADLKAATTIRNKEAADFAATEKELVESIDTLERAIMILEKEMKKGGAAMVQMQKAGNNLAQALEVMVDATMIGTQDAAKLTALMQSTENDGDADSEMGAPAAAVYEGHSGGIIDTLEGLNDKAKTSLETARAKENQNNQAFQMLRQGLEDEMKYANKDMSDTKKALAKTQEAKATAEGDLSDASKNLNEDTTTLKTLHQDCLEKANDFEAETKSRGEELKALAMAKKIISEMSAGADSLAYDSFLQVDSLRNGADLANFEAVRLVRELGNKMNDVALTQLAQRMANAVRRAKDGADPFGKVKELIKGMIEKLLNDAQSDASHKAYCDKELGESAEKKADRTAANDKLSAEIDSMNAKSSQLKEQVALLQKQLASMARSQAEMDRIRSEEKTAFAANKKEMEDGIKGIKMALKILRDYYAKDAAHESADGAGGGIVGMLEVVESDFTKGLAEMTATEQASAADYNRETQANEISKATKEQSEKYKTKEFKGLDKSVSEAQSDRATVRDELAAINSYLGQLDGMCIAKPEAYGERVARREAELSGLKEALSILDGQAVLLQRTASLRGVAHHKTA